MNHSWQRGDHKRICTKSCINIDNGYREYGRGDTKVNYLSAFLVLLDQYTMIKQYNLFYLPDNDHKISSEISLHF